MLINELKRNPEIIEMRIMKRYGNLYPDILDVDNIKSAIKSASLGKRKYRSVRPYLAHMQTTIMRIQTIMIDESYQPSHVKETLINEHGKHRIITSSPFFPDQIIHWAIMNILGPIFTQSMYEYNLATIPGRGGSLGKKKLEQWLRNDKHNTKYVLKTDIHHFYPSIDHEVLKNKLCRRFKDKQLLNLLFSIIDCYPTGLPLGLYTSQWFANYFLEREDHKIKEVYHVPYYLRYMDDMVFLGPNKKKLHRVLINLQSDMRKIGLEIKPTWQVWPVDSRPIDFLGFKFYRDHTTLRRRNFLNIKRKAKKIYKKGFVTPHDAHSMISYWGWIKHSDSYNFYQKYIKAYISIKKCKEVLKNGTLRNSSK